MSKDKRGRIVCWCRGYWFPHRKSSGACDHSSRADYYWAVRAGMDELECLALLSASDLERMFPLFGEFMTQPLTGDQLDHRPLVFGKHKGKTPAQIAEIDPQWLVWAYENITDKQVVSPALYKACKDEDKADRGNRFKVDPDDIEDVPW